MRVRTLKPIASSCGSFPPGVVVDVPDKVAKQWCEAGLAMQDKSLDGPSETKAKPRRRRIIKDRRRIGELKWK